MTSLLFNASPLPDWQPISSPRFPNACGVVHDSWPQLEGVPLGGIGTGFAELCANGRLARTSIFQSLTPPRELDWPPFALTIDGIQHALAQPAPGNLKAPLSIRMWGHYPVADFEFDLAAPVQAALRAWSPFILGDAIESNIPVAFFDFLLHNTSEDTRKVSLQVSFPGPTFEEAGIDLFHRIPSDGPYHGVALDCGPKMGMAVRIEGADHGSCMEDTQGAAERNLTFQSHVSLAPNETRHLRIGWGWYAREWRGTFYRDYTLFYTQRFNSAMEVLSYAMPRAEAWLDRIAGWQNAVYETQGLPHWLADQLINILHTITKDSFWAANSIPPVDWCKDGGIFGLSESPRTVPHVAIPSDFYGSLPFVFFFPDLLRQLLRSYVYYQLKTGEIPLGIGWNADLGSPIYDFLHTTNSSNFIDLVFRLWRAEGDIAVLHEFYPAVRDAVRYLSSLDRDKDGLLDLDPWPTGNQFYGGWHWSGTATHTNGFYIAALAMAAVMAHALGQKEDAAKFEVLRDVARQSHDRLLWNGKYFSLFNDVAAGLRDETILANQLVGLFLERLNGLPVSRAREHIGSVLDTVLKHNIGPAPCGMYNAIRPDGTLNPDGGDQSTQMFTGEALAVAATLLYEGNRKEGLALAESVMRNLVIDQNRGWNLPNQVSPESGKPVFGTDFYQMLMIWAIPLAIHNESIPQTVQEVGLIGGIRSQALESASI